MADFKIAYEITGGFEGGYNNNPNDKGGETFSGIARKFWPSWNGWTIIDAIKSSLDPKLSAKNKATAINKAAYAHPKIPYLLSDFYKKCFWDVNKLDLFTDQQLANNVYDFGVNAGVGKAAKTLQEVLVITADGIIGKQTLDKVNTSKCVSILYQAYNLKREIHYRNLAKNPTQKHFLNGWLDRLKNYMAKND